MPRLQIKRIQILKEHRDYLPKLTPEEKANLKKDMETNGQRTPIILLKGTTFLLDGHNRVDIARELKWTEINYEVEEAANAEAWIIKNQLSRRNLSQIDRDRLMAKLVKKGEKVEVVAKENKTSPSSVKRAVKQQDQLEKLPPKVQEAVKEAGTRRAASEAIKANNPDAAKVILKNRFWELLDAVRGIENGLENLRDEKYLHIAKVEAEIKKVVDFKKLPTLIEYLEKEWKSFPK